MAKDKWSAALCAAVTLVWLSVCGAAHARSDHFAGPNIVSFRIINLSVAPITAFAMSGSPLQQAAIRVAPGELLTGRGMYGGIDSDRYEMFWQFENGRVFRESVNIRNWLPLDFYGDIVFSVHDDHIEVSWWNLSRAWREANRDAANAWRTTSRYVDCDGPMFTDQLALELRAKAQILRKTKPQTRDDAERLAKEKCAFDSFRIPATAVRSIAKDEAERVKAVEDWKKAVSTMRLKSG